MYTCASIYMQLSLGAEVWVIVKIFIQFCSFSFQLSWITLLTRKSDAAFKKCFETKKPLPTVYGLIETCKQSQSPVIAGEVETP